MFFYPPSPFPLLYFPPPHPHLTFYILPTPRASPRVEEGLRDNELLNLFLDDYRAPSDKPTTITTKEDTKLKVGYVGCVWGGYGGWVRGRGELALHRCPR